MTIDQINRAEQIVNEIIDKDKPVFTEIIDLTTAKKIDGLRAMFDETYPDPVRVISVGVSVRSLIANPENKAGFLTSVEFCGGTYVSQIKEHLKTINDVFYVVVCLKKSVFYFFIFYICIYSQSRL